MEIKGDVRLQYVKMVFLTSIITTLALAKSVGRTTELNGIPGESVLRL